MSEQPTKIDLSNPKIETVAQELAEETGTSPGELVARANMLSAYVEVDTPTED
jgi:hypothetical protein